MSNNPKDVSDAEVERVAEAIRDLSQGVGFDYMDFCRDAARVAIAAMKALDATLTPDLVPVPMILHCPHCHLQHVDEPDERTPEWSNPPHRSHLCHGCGCIWRPADVPTEGVAAIQTKGKADTDLVPSDGEVRNMVEGMAKQMMPAEMDEEQLDAADWESGYEYMVREARSLLTRLTSLPAPIEEQ